MKSHRKTNLESLVKAYKIATELRLLNFSKKGTLDGALEKFVLYVRYQFLSHYFGSPPEWRIYLRRAMGKRVLPDFLLLGVAKGGSSDIATNVMLHPNIIPPFAKEINSINLDHWRYYFPAERYTRRLQRLGIDFRIGNFTPVLHSTQTMYRYYQEKPSGKIIIILRDPVDRAYSQWKWEVFLGGERAKSVPYCKNFSDFITEAIDQFPFAEFETFSRIPFLRTGIYFKSVELWIKLFGRENVIVLNADDYFKNRGSTLTQIYRFLNLAEVEIPSVDAIVNENPITLTAPKESDIEMLSEFYAPFNEKLFSLIGERFKWKGVE